MKDAVRAAATVQVIGLTKFAISRVVTVQSKISARQRTALLGEAANEEWDVGLKVSRFDFRCPWQSL